MACRTAERQDVQKAAEVGGESQGTCTMWEGFQGYLDILREWNLNTSARKISVSLNKPKYFYSVANEPHDNHISIYVLAHNNWRMRTILSPAFQCNHFLGTLYSFSPLISIPMFIWILHFSEHFLKKHETPVTNERHKILVYIFEKHSQFTYQHWCYL